MRAQQLWADKVHDKDHIPQSVFQLEFSPNGERLLAAVGHRVLVYNSADGTLIDSLKGHTGNVYCLAYSSDGQKFASGGSDKVVVLWTRDLEGILKYSHSGSIQALAFNPVTNLLASCSLHDFGLWSNEQKSVGKNKLTAKATCCAWTHDGQSLAIGLYNGTISIRKRNGEEKACIKRDENNPIWCLSWSSTYSDILTVGDWGQNLSFYQINGKQVGNDRHLGYDPCTLSYFSGGEFMLIAGSNKEAWLYSKEGVKLCLLLTEDSWIWSTVGHPSMHQVAIASQDGSISYLSLSFTMVHGIYRERYAFREALTDINVQHLVTEQSIKIKCRDLVRKVSLYHQRLAVLLTEQLVVYELVEDDINSDIDYKVKERIPKKLECNLLVACSQHILLCRDDKLQLMAFTGEIVREWRMDSVISYIKVAGGPPGKEGLLVALKDGHVFKLFIDSSFPVDLVTHHSAIRCVDISLSQEKLAVVDVNNTCAIYNVSNGELLCQEPDANSVSWNLQYDDMLCYSGNSWMYIKAGHFKSNKQKGTGFVVGFSGSHIYTLKMYSVQTVEVSLATQMHQFLEKKDCKSAYQIACLGVTEGDWKELGLIALQSLDLNVAKKSFIRVRDLHYLELIFQIEERISRGEQNNSIILADIHAYRGNFHEAAKLYKKSGEPGKAMDMFSDLRQFENAKEYIADSNQEHVKALIAKQAEWCQTINDPQTACDMYTAAGDYDKAIDLMTQHKWIERLADLGRKLNANDHTSILRNIATKLQKLNQLVLAVEILTKLGDTRAIIKVYVESEQWEEVLPLVEKYVEYKDDVYVPYATWLAEHDRFDEAQEAFNKAGKQSEATQVLEQLTENAIQENRFDDTGYYFYLTSRSYVDSYTQQTDNNTTANNEEGIIHDKFRKTLRLAEIYYAYHSIYKFTVQPFTNLQPETLFNISRFLINSLVGLVPGEDIFRISRASILYTLARQGRALEAYKLARYAYEQLQKLIPPKRLQDEIDMGSLTIRCKPFHDREELIPFCYRCSKNNPLINQNGNHCTNCKHPFVYSFISFEVLPLVEFQPTQDISHKEALKLIKMRPLSTTAHNVIPRNPQDIDTLVVDENGEGKDLFTEYLNSIDHASAEYTPLQIDRDILLGLSTPEVFIKHWPSPLVPQYYKSLLPELPISSCSSCFQLFHSDDYDLQLLQKNSCPFCRSSIDIQYNN